MADTIAGGSQAAWLPRRFIDNGDGTFSELVATTLQGADIQLGAVEIKNGTSDQRAVVDSNGSVRTILYDAAGNALLSAAKPGSVIPSIAAAVTGTFASAGDIGTAVTVALLGAQSVVIQLRDTFNLALIFEVSVDGGTNYLPISGQFTGINPALVPTASGGSFVSQSSQKTEVLVNGLGGNTHFRVRCVNYTSGTANVSVTASAFAQPYAPTPTAADNADSLATSANTWTPRVIAEQFGRSGTSTFDALRVPNIIKNIAAVAVTAAAPQTVWTPTSGKKVRPMRMAVSLSVAGSVIFVYGAGNTEFVRTPLLPAGQGVVLNLGNSNLLGSTNDVLKVDVTATGAVSGFVVGTEE